MITNFFPQEIGRSESSYRADAWNMIRGKPVGFPVELPGIASAIDPRHPRHISGVFCYHYLIININRVTALMSNTKYTADSAQKHLIFLCTDFPVVNNFSGGSNSTNPDSITVVADFS